MESKLKLLCFETRIGSNDLEGPGLNLHALYPESDTATFHGGWDHTVSVARRRLYAKRVTQPPKRPSGAAGLPATSERQDADSIFVWI